MDAFCMKLPNLLGALKCVKRCEPLVGSCVCVCVCHKQFETNLKQTLLFVQGT